MDFDKQIAYSPKYSKCRRCGREFDYNFYDRNIDHHMYCWECLNEMEKENKEKIQKEINTLHKPFE